LDNKLPRVPVLVLEFLNEDAIKGEVLKLGYILGKEERAKDYVDNFYDKYTNLIRTRTSGLSEDDKPTVYMEYSKPWHTYGTGSGNTIVRIAGGRNIFYDIDKYEADVDPESVMDRNPDIITRRAYANAAAKNVSYESDDVSDVKRLRDEILSRKELANVNAVKDKRVYIDDGNMATGIQMPIAIAYYAKLLQPELFSDLDPEAIQQEFLSKYCSLDYNLNEHGIFFYPPLDVSGNTEGVPDRIIKG
jgi:iron complex transport system substrate-binding protein